MSRPQYYWDRQEYLEDYRRTEETCSHIDSSENHQSQFTKSKITKFNDNNDSSSSATDYRHKIFQKARR